MIKKLENTLFFEFSKFSNIKKLKLNFLLLLKKKNFLLIFFFIIIVNQNNIFITDLFSSNEINIDTSQSILNDNIDKFFKIYDNFFEEIITDYNFDSAGNYKFYKTKKTIKENEKVLKKFFLKKLNKNYKEIKKLSKDDKLLNTNRFNLLKRIEFFYQISHKKFQDTYNIGIDALENLQEIKNTIKFAESELFIYMSFVCLKLNNKELAIEFFEKFSNFSKENPEILDDAKILLFCGIMSYELENFEKSFYYLQQLQNFNNGDIPEKFKKIILIYLSNINLILENYKKAIECLETLKMYYDSQDTSAIQKQNYFFILLNIAEITKKFIYSTKEAAEEMKITIKNYFEALYNIKLNELEIKDENGISDNISIFILNNLGNFALDNKEYEKAEYYFYEILKIKKIYLNSGNSINDYKKKLIEQYKYNYEYEIETKIFTLQTSLNFENANYFSSLFLLSNFLEKLSQIAIAKKEYSLAIYFQQELISLKYSKIIEILQNFAIKDQKRINLYDYNFTEYINDKIILYNLFILNNDQNNAELILLEILDIRKILLQDEDYFNRNEKLTFGQFRKIELKTIYFELAKNFYDKNKLNDAEKILNNLLDLLKNDNFATYEDEAKNQNLFLQENIAKLLQKIYEKKEAYKILTFEKLKNEIVIENKDSFEIEKAEKMILFLLDYFKIFKEDFYLKARIAFSFKNFKNKAIIEIQSLKDEAGYLNIFTDNNILLGKVILDRSIDNGLKAYPDTTLQNFINLFKLKINFDDINTKINEFNFQEKLSYLKNLLDKSKPQNDLETDTNQFFIESKISNEEIEIYVYKKNDDFNEKELSYKFTFTAEKTLKSFEIIGNCKIYFINYNNYILLKKIEFENEDFFNFINIIDFKFLN